MLLASPPPCAPARAARRAVAPAAPAVAAAASISAAPAPAPATAGVPAARIQPPRRSLALLLLSAPAFAAPALSQPSADSVPPALAAHAEAVSEPVSGGWFGLSPLGAAKLAGILLVADVVSALALGRSVLGIAGTKSAEAGAAEGQQRDWKEAAVDRLLGKTAAHAASAAAAVTAGAPQPPAATPRQARAARVRALVAQARGAAAAASAAAAGSDSSSVASPPLHFADVLAVIDDAYAFSPCGFATAAGTDAEVLNPRGANTGSLKVLSFAALNGLDSAATLALFAEHYGEVVANPGGGSHPNIRAFRAQGWDGVRFDGGRALAERRD